MQEVQTILPNGSIVRSRYEVEQLLGKGGFGAVYLVRDLRVRSNRFALKEVIGPNKQEWRRFLLEGELLKRLDHPALPRVYHVFEDEQRQRVYLLMDYVDGPNLEILRQKQPKKRFALPQVMRLMAPVVEALSYLHAQQPPIIHRDIKPANIIVPPPGEDAILVDFGIAKEYDQEGTTTAVRWLSPGYSAPEQYTQGTNPRTDVYCLAATFYALLTGVIPVDALSRLTHLGGYGSDPLESVNHLVPSLPAHVADAIHRAMSIDIDERFATVQAFWDALHARPLPPSSPEPITPLVGASLVGAVRTKPVSRTTSPSFAKEGNRAYEESPSKRRRLLALFFVFVALVALLVGSLFAVGILSPMPSPARKTAPITHVPTPTHLVPTATVPASPTSGASPTPSAQSQTTPASSMLASGYSGTIHDASANIDGSMSLSGIQQKGTNVSGTLTLSRGLQGQANFTGTFSSNKTLRFLVTPYAQYLPLLFQGQMNADGSLSGTYCSMRGNQCDYASGGYGTWKVYPLSPTSDTSLPASAEKYKKELERGIARAWVE